MKERSLINVEIPEALAQYVLEETKYCGRYVKKRKKGNKTHHLAKALGFYLLLKAESPGAGLIQDYTKQMPLLATNFNISQRSFYNYLNQLEEMKLITRESKNIRVAGWQQLSRVCEINTNKRTQIQFNYGTEQKIHWWFAALDIKSNQALQQDAVWKKANKNSDVAAVLLEAMIARGFDITRANNPEYFSSRLFMLYLEDFKSGTEVHDLLIHIRSDVNRSCKKLADSWCISPQLTSYWKKQMSAQKIIDVTKLTVTSEWSNETKECHKNKFCHVIWNPKIKERVWFLCDQITVLMPWEWQNFMDLKAAA